MSTTSTIHFVFNMHPHYHCVTFDCPYETITVKIILDEAHKAHKWTYALAAEPEARRENFQLRYIAEEKEAFSLAGLSDHDAILAKANDWYNNKGHFLDSSTRIGPDDSALLETVVPTPDYTVVRLYAIVAADVIPVLSDAQAPPLLAKRRIFIEKSQALLASGEDIEMSPSEDDPSKSTLDHPHYDPDLGSWATAYEPVFALATLALEGRLAVEPDVRALDENFEVIDGNAFDIRICVYDLRQVLRDVQYSPDSNNVEELKGLLRDLFDDPTLQVNVELATGEDGYLYAELEIIGECETAHGLPALYIMGKDKLIPNRWQMHMHEPEGFIAYRRAVVGPKYAGVREMTCCPCLIIEMCGYSVRVHAAYFSDDVYCTQLCDILLLHPSWPDGWPSEYSNTFQLQVVRKTAQELRRAYARVHTGSTLPGVPHLFPQFERLICPSLPCPLTLVDCVPPVDPPAPWPVGWSLPRAPLLFTGFVGRYDGSLGPVHVKFTSERKYGVAAHLLLAKYRPGGSSDSEAPQAQDSSDSDADADWDSYWPLAPAFLHGELIPGTHTRLVLMETLAGATLEQLLASPDPAAVSEADLADVRTAVAVLHRHGFVHGDIRPSNVLVQRPAPESDGPARAFLLDFDWAGRAGEARYPWALDERLSGRARCASCGAS
ncbi:hypothetical protein GSI_08203 [Ganoderma sinense ZZ0214-1]|uniref:Protein kinase domain-containing protein n=1 Tax=Ganoderma sinense ZZ0214-1 TaxID=1077348 RepID=A0A2G8S762_9APHY|nr:hypothetical protein GSI_08203 [Ganoderma sinense ZZ0214-1]